MVTVQFSLHVVGPQLTALRSLDALCMPGRLAGHLTQIGFVFSEETQ